MTNIMPPNHIKPADTTEKTFRLRNYLGSIVWLFVYAGFVISNFLGFLMALSFLAALKEATPIAVVVDTSEVLHTTSEKFLSVALDTSILQKGWRKFDLDSPTVANMVSALSPSYLRFGGTAADCLIFGSSPNDNVTTKYPVDGESCILGYEDCKLFHKNFTMSETEWLKINKFAQETGLDLIFDLNVLLRDGEDWDPSNALNLIKFSHDHKLTITWQLGNEPNSFNHVFKKQVTGTQLAKDFSMLREILNKVYGHHVEVVGPDVTRPRQQNLDAVTYLIDFLKEINVQGKGVIDAVTWHHYNLNGRDSYLKDYIDPSNFKLFYVQTQLVKSVVSLMAPELPVWITETSDAFGGGAPNITNRFVGSFMWMDKLGSAAANGIHVLARQSIFGGYYGLIGEDLVPEPDFWLSVLYKKLVGPKVLRTSIRDRKPCSINKMKKLKFYAHCSPHVEPYINGGAITIFGYNIGSQAETLALDYDFELAEGIRIYELTGEYGLQSRYMLLNGERLELSENGTLPPLKPIILRRKALTIPPFSMVFWQIYVAAYSLCD